MSLISNEVTTLSTDVQRAEMALIALRERVTSHANRQTKLKRFYRDWQQNWLSQAEQLRAQVDELEARLAPWMPREATPRLAVVIHSEEAA